MNFSKCTVVLALLFCISSSPSLSQAKKTAGNQRLTLTAHRNGNPIGELNRSFLYTADLLNESTISVDIEAIKMPGGYAGSGTFFACGVQTWDQKDHRWVLRHMVKLSEYGPSPHPKKIEATPGNHLEVCRSILPSQAGKFGDCARFIFQTTWNETEAIKVYSNTFVIGEQASSSSHACSTSASSTSTLLHESGHVIDPDPPKPQ